MVDASGKPWMDYPYADDGMDIWNTTASYFDKYLHLFYKDDQEVATDPELQAWWNEVKVGAGCVGWLCCNLTSGC